MSKPIRVNQAIKVPDKLTTTFFELPCVKSAIKYEDKETMCAIIGAMCFVENGQSVSEAAISKGYDMA